jgi:class 3 adenylate cyclase
LTAWGLRYFACMLSSALVITLIGTAAAWHAGHASDLYDLLPRVALLMGAACLPGAWLLFRPVERSLASGAAGPAPAARIRRLPILSAAWIFALAAATIAGHLGAAHHSWRAVLDAGAAMLGTLALHVALFAAYIALYVYFLLKEYTASLRLALWSSAGVVVEPGNEHMAVRLLVAFAAVAAGPLVLVVSGRAAVDTPMPSDMLAQHALLRQALELDLVAAAVFTLLLVVLVARSVARPARLLLEAMQRVDRGDLASRAPVVSDDELGKLTAGFNAMVDGLAQHEQMRRTFGRFVPEEVAAALLAEEGAIAPQERVATVLFTDIERFTQIASRLEPRQVLAMLNDYFGSVAAIIHDEGGVITQFQGDAVLAVFNLPAPASDHARRAVAAGLRILEVVPRTRVGISTGRVVGGTVGGAERLGYTVHGDTVNLAARLEALNKELGTRMLIDGRTAERLDGGVALRDHGSLSIRGLPVPIRIFEPGTRA